MKAVIQRVLQASVSIDGEIFSRIDQGLLVLLGISNEDDENDIAWLSKKISQLRIFNDENDVMNKSLIDVNGNALVVSQFTLLASTKKGNRPSYIQAAGPDIAIPLYKKFVAQFESDLGREIKTGIFGADMKVSLVNDGPVTIIIDTKNKE
ncbi:D-aminoacyl-tRNA deacylase [Namhaeicola litoreus]|uniref:D-aminoacyl-tRNA deacylase n=1 Tax=Namhaeicola litoreus TaxID=1052145 RepID=A0ABW3XY70_9FLAO